MQEVFYIQNSSRTTAHLAEVVSREYERYKNTLGLNEEKMDRILRPAFEGRDFGAAPRLPVSGVVIAYSGIVLEHPPTGEADVGRTLCAIARDEHGAHLWYTPIGRLTQRAKGVNLYRPHLFRLLSETVEPTAERYYHRTAESLETQGVRVSDFRLQELVEFGTRQGVTL